MLLLALPQMLKGEHYVGLHYLGSEFRFARLEPDQDELSLVRQSREQGH